MCVCGVCVFHHRLLGKTTIALHQLSRSGKLDSNFPLTGKDGSPTTVSACVWCVCVCVCVDVCGWVGGCWGVWVSGDVCDNVCACVFILFVTACSLVFDFVSKNVKECMLLMK